MMKSHPLAELFPMLPEAEIRDLAGDIVTYGQRVPIVLLDGMVLDGRNRLAACRFADLKPVFTDYEGDDPLSFVLSHNLHRRHLNESQRAMVAARLVDWDIGLNQNTAGPANLPTRKAAERLSISERAVRAALRIRERGADELVEAIRDGRVSVHAGEALSDLAHEAQREVLDREERHHLARAKEIRAERQQRRHAQRLESMRAVEEEGQASAPGKVRRRYPVIYADPPWQFGVRSEVTGREKSAENHYPTMPTEDICALFSEIGDPKAGAAVLFLWATNPMLIDALRVMQAWGFAYVHHWIWDKEVAGTGYWGRDRHELLLIGRRGDVAAPLPGSQPETVHRERKTKHSAKPDFFAETIERLYPGLPRLELFCRTPRPGWDVWGFEAFEDRNSPGLASETRGGDGDDCSVGKRGAWPPQGGESSTRALIDIGAEQVVTGGESAATNSDRPSVTDDELNEWKALGCLQGGMTVTGPLVDDLVERGLWFGKAMGITVAGAERLAELDVKVKAASADDGGVNVVNAPHPSPAATPSPQGGEEKKRRPRKAVPA